ncbi:MAG: hypothetical protein IPQ07_08905 [Myxococcales bacterium]|nr:hypothetical protein [Myxococcales bacterium]
MKIALTTLVLAACSFPTPSEQYSCRTTDDCDDGRVCTQGYCVIGNVIDIDAPMTDTPPMIDCTTFPSRHFDACMIPAPTGALELTTAGTYTFDTTAGSLLAPGGGASLPPSGVIANGRVVSVSSLTIGAGVTLRVIGANPLIIASWGTVDVAGTIDASSLGTAGSVGAGANPTGCATHVASVGQNGAGAGGGGGGGATSVGGRGGGGNNGANNGGNGGALIAAPLLLGGCPGARGGLGNSTPGDGGDGGGAVQLTARLSVTVAATGSVLAGGAGGKPGAASGSGGGGGGGGAGGMVGIEAPMLTLAAGAVIAANGGGGGQGAGNNVGNAGQNGQPSAARATGGNTGSGGVGGLGGGGLITAGGNGATDGSGGGGAGGASGFISFKAAMRSVAGAIVSPTATIVP